MTKTIEEGFLVLNEENLKYLAKGFKKTKNSIKQKINNKYKRIIEKNTWLYE